MKHIFTFLALLSLLLCLLFIVVAVATINSSWEVQLGKTDPRIRSAGARYGELVYTDRVTANSESMDLTKTTTEYPGLVVHKEARRHPKAGEAESASYTYALSPAYPIIVFAILPLAWLVARFGRKRKPAGGSHESEEPASTSPHRP